MRLLLVEDTARLIELMTEAVHDAGWQIDAVTTVQDAEEVLATTPYDLLLFDLGLPDGDGLDLVGHRFLYCPRGSASRYYPIWALPQHRRCRFQLAYALPHSTP